MLKYVRGLILCLVVLTELAYVSPTYAASANVVITQIQAGGAGAALDEIVVLYNNSTSEVDISDWCLRNKSNLTFVCFKHEPFKRVFLPPYHYATIASYNLATTLNYYDFTYTYMPLNNSSGSITGGSDTITLANQNGEAIDSHYWTTSLVGGMVLERLLSPTDPLAYLDTNETSNWQIHSPLTFPPSGAVIRTGDIDACPNLDGPQSNIPEGYEVDGNGNCIVAPTLLPLKLTELLPNAVGSDTGSEFIELYNPNDQAVNLAGYQLWVGVAYEKAYDFPEGSVIEPHSFHSFSNTEIHFSLLNSSSGVALIKDGALVDQTPLYSEPEEGASWALVNEQWQYVSPTPGSENTSVSFITDQNDQTKNEVTQKPCADNQYRSPETNRCRLVETTQKTQTPCKDNQYRSEETNRCRNIASTDGPTPCKEGQERSPETNRCRTVKKISDANYEVLGATTSSDETNWYVWAAIGGILLLALAYSIWEWRFEISRLFERLTKFVGIRK